MIALLWLLGFAFMGLQTPAHTSNDLLKLLIKNTSSVEGAIVVVAYAEEAHFLTEKGKVLKGQQQMANDTLEFVVEQLDPGTYALVVFEDLNENGLLDRNKLGIPQEPFGFSKAKMGLFGPPSFENASFAFPQENGIEVQLKSL